MSALLQRIVRNACRGSSGVAFFVAVGACARHSIFNDSIKEINSFYCLKNIRIFLFFTNLINVDMRRCVVQIKIYPLRFKYLKLSFIFCRIVYSDLIFFINIFWKCNIVFT